MEQQDWDENAANWWRETSGAVVQNGAAGTEELGNHDGYPASDADFYWSQSRVKQPGAATSTTSEVPAASRLRWSFDPTCRKKLEIAQRRMCKELCTRRKGFDKSPESHSVHAISVLKEVALSEIRSMAWNWRRYQERWAAAHPES